MSGAAGGRQGDVGQVYWYRVLMEFDKKTLIFLLIIIAIVIFGVIIAYYGFNPPSFSRGVIKVWGFDENDIYRDLIIREFKQEYPYLDIQYTQKSPQNYERELLNALAGGNGPDVFPIHHTWLYRYQDKISPLPGELMALREYYDTFVDVASMDFVADGNIWAIPFDVDTLALYWNKAIFNTAGVPEPPKNWNDFLETVARLTLKDEAGKISRSGGALGTSPNVNYSSDILFLLMLQNGTTMIDEQTGRAVFNQSLVQEGQYYKPGAEALRFYTDFADPRKTAYCWNVRMPNSLEAFLRGETAMILDYSSAAAAISKEAPYLDFAIAPMPQIKGKDIAINYADYWGYAVWSASQNSKNAWQFLLWRVKKENLQKYLQLAKKPASRRDLINWQKDDPLLGVFTTQSLSARSWFQVDNKAISDIFNQMIELVITGQATVEDALERGANQVNLLIKESQKSNPSGQYTPGLPLGQ